MGIYMAQKPADASDPSHKAVSFLGLRRAIPAAE
jgi:hypothetical protein